MPVNEAKIIISGEDRTRAAVASARAGLLSLQKSADSLAGSLGLIGGGIGVAAFVGLVKSSIDAADNLRDLAIRAGTTTESLASYKLAAEQSGTSVESLAAGLGKLTVFMANNSKEAERLGISATDPVQAFAQLSDALARTVNPAERNAIANKVLGKSYAELLPLLSEGGAALRKSADDSSEYAKKLGAMAVNADKFNDELGRLKQEASFAGISIAENLLPALNDAIQRFTEAKRISGSFLDGLDAAVGLGLRNPFKTAGDNVISIKEDLDKLAEARDRFVKSKADPSAIDIGIKKLEKDLEFAKFVQRQEALALGKGFEDYKIPDRSVKKSTLRFDDGSDAVNSAKNAAKKIASERQKIFDANRKQEAENARVEFDIDFSAIEAGDDAFRRQRDRIADLKKEFIELIDPVEKYRVKLNEIDEAEQAGALSAEQANEARFKINDAIDAQLEFGKAIKETNDYAKEVGLTFTSAFEDAIVGGKGFSQVLKGIADDLLRLAIRKTITENFSNNSGEYFSKAASFIGSLFTASANGNVFNSPGLSAYSGQVVSKPTLFPFASGIGLMGEAGAEAILPLKRGSDGKLGVGLSGGASSGTVNNISIVINNDQSTQRSASDQESSQLAKRLEAAVKQVLLNEKRSGGLLAN